MTNSAECVIKKVDYRVPCSLRPSIIWVELSEEQIAKQCRREYNHLYNDSVQKSWIPILEVMRQFTKHRIQVLPRQFPFRPSAAKTIHCGKVNIRTLVVDLPSTYALCSTE